MSACLLHECTIDRSPCLLLLSLSHVAWGNREPVCNLQRPVFLIDIPCMYSRRCVSSASSARSLRADAISLVSCHRHDMHDVKSEVAIARASAQTRTLERAGMLAETIARQRERSGVRRPRCYRARVCVIRARARRSRHIVVRFAAESRACPLEHGAARARRSLAGPPRARGGGFSAQRQREKAARPALIANNVPEACA